MTEEVILQRRMVSDVNGDQLQRLNVILEEGVDANLQRWDEWKQRNTSKFLLEVVHAQRLIVPLL
jgi:hypothetical protein